MAFVLTNDSVTIQVPHPTGDRQLRLQRQLAPRLVDTDGQGQVAKARERDVPQEGEVPGDRAKIDTEQSFLALPSFWNSRCQGRLGLARTESRLISQLLGSYCSLKMLEDCLIKYFLLSDCFRCARFKQKWRSKCTRGDFLQKQQGDGFDILINTFIRRLIELVTCFRHSSPIGTHYPEKWSRSLREGQWRLVSSKREKFFSIEKILLKGLEYARCWHRGGEVGGADHGE